MVSLLSGSFAATVAADPFLFLPQAAISE